MQFGASKMRRLPPPARLNRAQGVVLSVVEFEPRGTGLTKHGPRVFKMYERGEEDMFGQTWSSCVLYERGGEERSAEPVTIIDCSE